MIIRSVRHRGLLRLIENDDRREIRPDLVKRLRNILAVLILAVDMDAVSGPPGWRVHQLKGDRSGTWTISVSGNWRLTFDIEQSEISNPTWKTTTDEHDTQEDRHDATSPRRVYP
jgi:proteic killer suppression protein